MILGNVACAALVTDLMVAHAHFGGELHTWWTGFLTVAVVADRVITGVAASTGIAAVRRAGATVNGWHKD